MQLSLFVNFILSGNLFLSGSVHNAQEAAALSGYILGDLAGLSTFGKNCCAVACMFHALYILALHFHYEPSGMHGQV